MKAITIYYDPCNGHATKITESPRFAGEYPLMRADVLQDILHELEARYEVSRKQIFTKKRKKAG
jgi:hypothetical protein